MKESDVKMQVINLNLTNKELLVIVDLINNYQFDGCRYKIDGIGLTELKRKIKDYVGK